MGGGGGGPEPKGVGSSVFEPSKMGGLCNFDIHIGGGSSYLFINFMKSCIISIYN